LSVEKPFAPKKEPKNAEKKKGLRGYLSLDQRRTQASP